jgi:hypothetical protein
MTPLQKMRMKCLELAVAYRSDVVRDAATFEQYLLRPESSEASDTDPQESDQVYCDPEQQPS